MRHALTVDDLIIKLTGLKQQGIVSGKEKIAIHEHHSILNFSGEHDVYFEYPDEVAEGPTYGIYTDLAMFDETNQKRVRRQKTPLDSSLLEPVLYLWT
jgi:hypothetical protein